MRVRERLTRDARALPCNRRKRRRGNLAAAAAAAAAATAVFVDNKEEREVDNLQVAFAYCDLGRGGRGGDGNKLENSDTKAAVSCAREN